MSCFSTFIHGKQPDLVIRQIKAIKYKWVMCCYKNRLFLFENRSTKQSCSFSGKSWMHCMIETIHGKNIGRIWM